MGALEEALAKWEGLIVNLTMDSVVVLEEWEDLMTLEEECKVSQVFSKVPLGVVHLLQLKHKPIWKMEKR